MSIGLKSFSASLLLCVVACGGSAPRVDGFVPLGTLASPDARGAHLSLQVSIPAKGVSGSHAGTLDPSTRSVKVSINSAAPTVFGFSQKAKGCKKAKSEIVCTFTVAAVVGSDTLSLQTYRSANATGPSLNSVKAVVPLAANKGSLLISAVVTSLSDTGPGSLRQCVSKAQPGSTIVYSGHSHKTITLTSGAIDITKRLAIAGPGPTALSVSAKGKTQILTVNPGVDSTISGLTLTDGAAVGASTAGGAIYNSGSLTLYDDTISDNFAGSHTLAATTDVRLGGVSTGARRFDPRPRTRASRPPRPPRAKSLAHPSVTSPGEGGAVYNAGTLTVTDAIFSRNGVEQGSGGAIYNAAGATLAITDSSFTDNSGAQGGAIDNEGNSTLDSDSFANNAGWPGSGAPVSGAYGYGAALYVDGHLSADECTFSGNVAGGNVSASFGLGGAIAQYGGALSISNSQFTGNLAGGGTKGSWGRGGAIYSAAGTITLAEDKLTGNKAGGDAFGYGGAVFAANALTGTSLTFSDNTAYGSASGGFGFGGAVYAGGALSLKGGSFAANVVAGGSPGLYGYGYGGAVDIEDGSTLTGVTFASNSVTAGLGGSAEGGAVFVNGGSNAWSTPVFTSNSAMATGPSSYSAGGAAMLFSAVTLTSGQLTSNSAIAAASGALAGVGGAIALEVGPLSFTGTMSSNNATTAGGGIWIDDSAAVSQSTIASNHVNGTQDPNDGGGGIYDAIGATLALTASTITGNAVTGNASSSGGGGIFNEGVAAIANTTITANSSDVDGGGIENEAQSGLSLTNATVYQNVASSRGGNVKNLFSDSGMSIANTIVAGGTAATGADVSNDGTITSLDYNIVQTTASGTAITGTTTHNLAVNPLLLPLASNGGPTETNADQATSPGKAYIPYSVCSAAGITSDQRGNSRNSGGFCDVGAYEF